VSVGRNDPCPCGSGRKYKKCCLAADASPRHEPSEEVRTSAVRAVLRFGARPEYREAHAQASEAFRGRGPLPEMEDEVATDADLKLLFYLAFDREVDAGESLAAAFLRRAAWQVAVPERRFIARLAAARLRLYEVHEVRLDEGVRLRDLWTDEEAFVTERSATHGLTRWDLLAARVAPEDDGSLRFEGGLYFFPPRLKGELLGALRDLQRSLRRSQPDLDDDTLFRHAAVLFNRFWLERVVTPQPLPSIVTAEGDPMEFGKVVFDVRDRPGVIEALERHPEIERDEDAWRWFEDASDGMRRSLTSLKLEGDRLVAEVTSRQRASRVRRLLEEAAASALRYRSARYESVEDALERRRAEPPSEDGDPIPPDVAARFITEYKERHYSTWPDIPLPALDGRTPRDAAGDAKLRPRLVDLLKDMENHELRAARDDTPAFDFGRISPSCPVSG